MVIQSLWVLNIFLERYIIETEEGLLDPNGEPEVDKETTATAVVNGNNGFGAVIGSFL